MVKKEQAGMDLKEEKNGYKMGINTNPDLANIPEEKRWKLEFPNGDRVSGNQSTIMKLFKRFSEQ